MQKMTDLLKRPIMRYLIVGGSVYVLEVVIIIVAQRAGATAVIAVAISYIIGLIISFLMQKLITFGDRRMHHKILIPQLIAVTLLIIWNLLFTILVTKLLSPAVPTVISRTIALGITVIWNFYLYKTRIFNQHPSVPLDV